jgi:hypothetical protein
MHLGVAWTLSAKVRGELQLIPSGHMGIQGNPLDFCLVGTILLLEAGLRPRAATMTWHILHLSRSAGEANWSLVEDIIGLRECVPKQDL